MSEAASRTPLSDPIPGAYRWIVLVTTGLMLFGSYFAYDSISAISQLLIEQEGYTATQVGLVDSLYSWPNILGAVLVAGILVDKFGTRAMSVIFSGLVVLGAVVVAAAPSFIAVLIGRATLGVGAEALAVCQMAILHKWFRRKDLALSFGLALVFLRLGSVASQNLETAVANHHGGVSAALWFAAIMCMVSMVFAVFYVALERAAEGKVELVAKGRDELVLADISRFDARFWCVLVLVTACYCGILPFRALAQDFFHDKWGIVPATGASLVSILSLSSMILVPAIGYAVDRRGRRATLLVWGAALMIPAHLSLGFANLHPLYPMMILGLSYSLVAAVVWPAVPLIVGSERVGTATGLIFMIQNIGLAVFPVVNGALRDATDSYASSQLMFASLGLIGLAAALLLRGADREAGGALEKKSDAEAKEP